MFISGNARFSDVPAYSQFSNPLYNGWSPVEELRYRRTVIVTAAVHRGFSLPPKWLPLTFRHWAGLSPYTLAFAFAETCVLVKQSVNTLLLWSDVTSDRTSPNVTSSYFAEFLKLPSPVRLRLLVQSTCVGLRYDFS